MASIDGVHWQAGCGPLYYAAQGGIDEVVQLLLDSRADVNAADKVRLPCSGHL
jgi:ankyrin repeat protein